MNILVTYPWLDLGGAPNTAITLAKGLRELGHDVWFLTSEGGMYEDRLKGAGLNVVTAPYHRTLPHMYHLNHRAHRILTETLESRGIDIVHAFHPQSWILALFSAPARGIPVFLTAVWYVDGYPYPAYPGWLLFVAEEFRDQAAPFFGPHPRLMEIMPNRIDLEMFRPGIDASGFIAEHGLPEADCRIVMMGRMDRSKLRSFQYAVEEIGLLGGRGIAASLVIAGGGDSRGEIAAAGARVNDALGREAVKMLGPVGRTPELLSAADIVFGIGRCAWEGMACAKPAVIVGENGFAGIAEPSKVAELAYYNFAGRNRTAPAPRGELAGVTERLIRDAELRGRLGAFSREYVVENYDYRAGARRLEELYARALGERPLTGGEYRRLRRTLWTRGYARRMYIALRMRMKGAPVMGAPSCRG